MADRKLSELLIARAFSSRLERQGLQPTSASVAPTRRQCPATAGGGGMAAAAPVAASREPRIVKHGRAVIVYFRGRTWRVDAAGFGESARADWHRDRRHLFVDLSRAFLPGTDLAI